ncbi:MAG TPA: hypothetical protein VGR35_13185 [Tepidisphaeraceae bacterium]|nr:hypothetical protein [Tepidisphaeraceae bacterium]
MRYPTLMLVLGLFVLSPLASTPLARAADDAPGTYPKPSPYPITWELKFKHSEPKRIVVDLPGQAPQAFWYMMYTVINNTDQSRTFLPVFEMLTDDGTVIRSDRNIPYKVFEQIKAREKSKYLEHFTQIGGEVRIGEDEARDGVAIWKEPMAEMGSFAIFVTGLSGETARLKDAEGNEMKDAKGEPIILRKTLQMNYHVRGDEVYPGLDEVNRRSEQWIMR